MKITILSYFDWAGSGYKLSQAISKHTEHDIQFFSEKYDVFFNHPYNTNYISDDIIKVQNHIDESDIVHIKGDYPPLFIEGSTKLIISHKPIIQTVSGSHFRRKQYGGMGTFDIKYYDQCKVKTSFEPDLLYDDYSDILTPYPIDCMDKPNLWKPKERLTFSHFPSNRNTKDTDFIEAVFKELKYDCEIIIPRKPVEYNDAMRIKLESSIYFDQFLVGAYGNSAVEMMQYGIPVACWLNHDYGGPILTANKTVKEWVKMLSNLPDLQQLSKDTKQYCNETHSYQAVAKQWDEIYKATC